MKILILALSFFHFAHATDEDLLWRARGLQAKENVEDLAKKIEKATGKKKLELQCEGDAERAYLAFANKETNSIVTKKTGDTVWRILLFGPTDDYTQVSFVYDAGKASPKAWKIAALSKEWQAISIVGSTGLGLVGGKCTFLISPENPFHVEGAPRPD